MGLIGHPHFIKNIDAVEWSIYPQREGEGGSLSYSQCIFSCEGSCAREDSRESARKIEPNGIGKNDWKMAREIIASSRDIFSKKSSLETKKEPVTF